MQTGTCASASQTTGSTKGLPLSIVVATTKPWPEIRACLDPLVEQSKSVGAEILVADGYGGGLPEMEKESYEGVMWLKNPGASVFGLRKLGMSHARGEIIAITEDHCRVAPNWCEQIIQVHKDYPDAAAIGGEVENGATTSLIDWANFFLVFAPFVSPIRNGPSERICLQANISYKRRVVSRMASQLGVMEMLFTRQLRQEGEVLIADDRLLVSHVQSHGFWGTFAAHFHNGRSIAGFRLEELGGVGRILRLGSTAILPPYLLWSTLRALMSKQQLLGESLCKSASARAPRMLSCSRGIYRLYGWAWPKSATVGLVKKEALMPKRWKRILLYAGYLLLVTLPLLEMGVRIWGYAERHIYDPIYRSFEPSEDIPYIHKPNLLHAHARGLAVINTDSLGLRATTSGMVYGIKQLHEYRIAIVGDSVTFGEGIPRTEDTYAQVLEDTLNRQQEAVAVKVFNFGASAYSVKQMAAILQYRMVDIQPDLVVMAIIPQDFNLSRTPIMDGSGYLVDQRIGILLDSPVREVLRGIHLLYVLREIALPWLSSSQNYGFLLSGGEILPSYQYIQHFNETADRYGLSSLIVLLPRMQENAWGSFPEKLTQDAVTYLDLSPLGKEFTKEEYLASRFDPHASPAVHRRIGESLAAHVQGQLEFRQ